MTACLRFPLPSVASACLSSSYWWEPSGMFFFGLKVLDERLPLQTREHRTKQPCVNVSWLYKCPQGVETSLCILFNISLSSLLLTSSVHTTSHICSWRKSAWESLSCRMYLRKPPKNWARKHFDWLHISSPFYTPSLPFSLFPFRTNSYLNPHVRQFQKMVEMWYKCLNLKYFKLYIVFWILWHKLCLLI